MTPETTFMTEQDCIAMLAQRFAKQKRAPYANKVFAEIQTLCGCSSKDALTICYKALSKAFPPKNNKQ